MWIFSKVGFFSITKVPNGHPDELQIRARTRGDLLCLCALCGLHISCIKHTPKGDYGWRIFVSRPMWEHKIAPKLTQTIDYDNFKDAMDDTPTQRDKHWFLSRVWHEGYDYQATRGVK